ncbi:hypothetical protein [Sphingomonas horti]|nr:hypothetical protein [Sphingomonas horti]
MDREPDWKARAVALEWWTATAIVAGALIYGVVSAAIALLGV